MFRPTTPGRAVSVIAVLALVASSLACGFGERCDSKTFVPTCTDQTTYNVCAAGSGYKGYVQTRSCSMNEICIRDAVGEPTCGIGPPLATCETDDDYRCVDGQLQECNGKLVKSAKGEMFWSHDRYCPSSEKTCVQHGNAAGCVDEGAAECTVDHLSECDGNTPRVCHLLSGNHADGDPKGFWSRLDPCDADEACIATDARTFCVVSPVEPCPGSSGETRCVDGRLQKCFRGRTHPTLGEPPDPHWIWTEDACP